MRDVDSLRQAWTSEGLRMDDWNYKVRMTSTEQSTQQTAGRSVTQDEILDNFLLFKAAVSRGEEQNQIGCALNYA